MKKLKYITLLIAISIFQLACKKFLEIDGPKSSLIQKTIFDNNEIANSAVLGIYNQMAATGYASGNVNSISALTGLSSDEYIGYNSILQEFGENQITPQHSYINSAWSDLYSRIYAANSILEGLAAENGVSPPMKTLLEGEAYFIRAFNYFYLVNMFGAIPLHLTTDYEINSKATRMPVDDVYKQIISDLKVAEILLNDDYVNIERVRPNRAAVQALLSRVYLYSQDWINAEKYAEIVIKKGNYALVDPDNVFLKNSQETIWQLMPPANSNSPDGGLLILTGTPVSVSLRPDFTTNAFEANDKRKVSWLRTLTNSTGTYYYPFKYKVRSSTVVTEYSMVLRLAEQYLIRSEARCQQNNLNGSIDDLDKIRERAGLKLIKITNPDISKSNLLLAIQKERRTELFSEWGHRWFDLKRTGQASAVLKPIKAKWENTDVLFPIPEAETSRNINIIQNDGYQFN